MNYCNYICSNCKTQCNGTLKDIQTTIYKDTTTWKCSNFNPIYIAVREKSTTFINYYKKRRGKNGKRAEFETYQ